MRIYERTQYRTTYGTDLQTRIIMRRRWKETCLRIRAELKIENEKLLAELRRKRAARLARLAAIMTEKDKLRIGKKIVELKRATPRGKYFDAKKELVKNLKLGLSTVYTYEKLYRQYEKEQNESQSNLQSA